jgi:DNA-binding CsgD family transcriptional regulator
MTEATAPAAGNAAAARTPRRRAAGREALHAAARARLADGGLLVTGPAGAGRSTLLERLAREHADAGHRVLRCAPAPQDRDSPYLGLMDLLSGVDDAHFAVLPDHQRALLEGALLRGTMPAGTEPPAGRDALLLRAAVRTVLTDLACTAPLLLVVDDAQWLDTATADVLAFLARRPREQGPALLVALRTHGVPDPQGPGQGPAGELGRADVERWSAGPLPHLAVPPLTALEAAALLDEAEPEHAGPPWPPAVVARLHHAAGGNPARLLDLSAALAERVRAAGGVLPDAGDPLPVPEHLRRPLLDRIEALPPGARRTLLTAGAAASPTVALLVRAGCQNASADVDLCVRRGLLEQPLRGVLRFADPLVPVVLQAEAGYEQRAAVHRSLAAAADDAVERAHHLARLTAGPDPEVAARLADAASAARRRGAPGTAARLGRLAAEHTPAGQRDVDTDRRLTAAEDAVAAGDFAFARQLAYQVLGAVDRPAERVRAWTVVVDSCGQAMSEIDDVFPEALRDAGGDPRLLAPLHYRMSWREWMVGGSAARAHPHAARSAELAGAAGDRHTQLLALTQQAALELFLGLPAASGTLAAALAAPHDARAMADHNGPIYLKHRFLLADDRPDAARRELRSLVFTQRQRGSAESLSQCLMALAQVEVHRGRCRQALTIARQSLRIAQQAGLSQGPAWYALALAETAGGSLPQALAAAETARRHSEDDDDRLFLPRALHAEGRVLLLTGQPARAAELLRRTAEMETGQGLRDPAMRRWHADLAEALARSGEIAEAEEVVAAARTQAVRLGRRGVLAALDRAAGLVAEARGDLDRAAGLLAGAAARLGAFPYVLEEGRTRIALGRVHRARGDEAASRAAFAEALRIFTRAGARTWVAVARAERDRAGGGDMAPPDGPWSERLTSTERSVVARVAEGASNREIAAGLVVSVKTVEAALTRAYRKLGARSRVEVTRIVMARPTA